MKAYILIFLSIFQFGIQINSQNCLLGNLDSLQNSVNEILKAKLSNDSNKYSPLNFNLSYDEISFYFKKSNFCTYLPQLLKENNDWRNLIIIYHFTESGGDQYFITYLFDNGRHSKAYTYQASLNKWHTAINVKTRAIEKLKISNEYVDGSLILINSFDKTLRLTKSKIYIGPPLIDQEEQLFKIYFQDKVYN